ncbi:MAG: hypothetical protein NVSMB27_39220 [Ktedonobacteraceae bacterium]
MNMDMGTASARQDTSNVAIDTSEAIPARILEIELGQPLHGVSAIDEKTEHCYQRVLSLIRLHTQPLGIVELQLDEREIGADACAQHIWQKLQAPINEHLQQDGLPPVTGLDAAGLPVTDLPHCIEEREQFFACAPFVSIIVSTRDRPVEMLQICLRSLLALHYPQYEIIVVDNAPMTNALANLIQQAYRDMPQVRYIREDRPGLSWARNSGIAIARGEILVFTDDDVVVDPYWLIELVKGFSAAENVACVTGLVMPSELETPAQLWFEQTGGFGKGFTRRIFDLGGHRPKNIALYPYHTGHFGTGASMAFTAAFLRSIGGFDPAMGGDGAVRCGQDTAAFFQVIIGGYQLVYEPASLLYHSHRRDYAGLRKQIYNYGVGLTAYLTKIILDHPWLLFDFTIKVPYGIFLTLHDRLPKEGEKLNRYTKELATLELKGMLYGPFAYIYGRWATRGSRRPFAEEAYIASSTGKEIL